MPRGTVSRNLRSLSGFGAAWLFLWCVMRYGSICSGIEAFSVAVSDLGWSPAWFAEIDPFCCELLATRYPEVRNYGDITKKEPKSFWPVDIIAGGTPCQSFSVNGNRKGMDDGRGQLSLRFCEIVAACQPRWVVWENVPGILSSEHRRGFGAIIRELEELGYSLAWRVLDARYFGVAQSRRRVFVVGSNRSWRHAAAALFERRPSKENAKPAGKERQGRVRVGSDTQRRIIGWAGDETPKFRDGITPTLRASQGGEGVGILEDGRMSKLTINEWERLQGFEDDYTAIGTWSESQRRKAIGNSFAVPVLRWITTRIDFLDGIL